MLKYEILTENKNYQYIESAVSKYFSGFSIVEQTGFWNRCQEESLNITIIAEKSKRHLIRHIAEKIKSCNEQQSVMIVISKVKTVFI